MDSDPDADRGTVPEPLPEGLTDATPSWPAPAHGRFGGLGANYWKLWSASVVSNLGDGVSIIAYPWLASLLTRDPVLIAGVGVAQRLPWLLFTLPAGAITDRCDRRQLMVAMNAIRFVLTLAVALAILAESMTIPLLYLATALLGCAEVIYDNSSQTILPSVVSKDRLQRANGNLWGAELVLNQFVGPPLGGFLIAAAVSAPFAFDAVTFGVSAVVIYLIGGAFRARSAEAMPARRSMLSEIREGFGWLWRHPLLRSLAIVLGIMNAMSTAAYATIVLFAQEILDLSAAGFGVLTAAAAIGGILGSLLATAVTKRIGPGPSLYTCLVAGVVTSIVIGLTSHAFVVGAMQVVFMFTAMLWNVITVSLRQTIIPDHLLGRVNSVYRFFGWGMMPLGALLGGGVVAVTQTFATRVLALRMPFFVSGAVYLGAFLFSLSRLSTGSIESAQAAAEAPS